MIKSAPINKADFGANYNHSQPKVSAVKVIACNVNPEKAGDSLNLGGHQRLQIFMNTFRLSPCISFSELHAKVCDYWGLRSVDFSLYTVDDDKNLEDVSNLDEQATKWFEDIIDRIAYARKQI